MSESATGIVRATVLIAGALALWMPASPASAQELSLKRATQLAGGFECPALPAPVEPTDDARARAAALASDASEATILGDRTAALDLLREAAGLDPLSLDIAYRYARALEEAGDLEAALTQYCRAIALEPTGPDVPDARTRVELLAEETRPNPSAMAVRNFSNGVALAEMGQYENALANLDRAVSEAPGWADAHYNRAVVLLEMGRPAPAEAALARYLELAPDAPDVIEVSQQLGALQARQTTGAPSPGAALAVGVVPGMGQMYTGRPGLGFGFLTLAGASAATSILHERADGETFLVPGISIAATTAFVGAMDAYFEARRLRSGGGYQPSPGNAFALGLVPGLGHAYTGRSGMGLAFMTVASGLVMLSDIAEDQSHRQVVEAALVPAAGVALAGAFDAALHERRRQSTAPPSPWTALALGVAPGLGQYYAGRSGVGFVVTSLAMTSVAATFTYEEAEGRGYYPTGLYVAGGITALGAIEAFFGARRVARGQGTGSGGGFALGDGAATLHGPSLVGTGPEGGVSVALGRLTF